MAIRYTLGNGASETATGATNTYDAFVSDPNSPVGLSSPSVPSLGSATISWSTDDADAPGTATWPTTGYDLQIEYTSLSADLTVTGVATQRDQAAGGFVRADSFSFSAPVGTGVKTLCSNATWANANLSGGNATDVWSVFVFYANASMMSALAPTHVVNDQSQSYMEGDWTSGAPAPVRMLASLGVGK